MEISDWNCAYVGANAYEPKGVGAGSQELWGPGALGTWRCGGLVPRDVEAWGPGT